MIIDINKKLLVILIFAIIIALVGYLYFFRSTVAREIINWEKNNCTNNQSCQLKLADITDFSWDSLYYFDIAMTKDEVSKIMNISVERYTPGNRTIVFIKDGQIVRTEYLSNDVEGYENNEVVFRGLNDNYGKYDSNTIFRIVKNQQTSYTYYVLEPTANE
jgi:hypothetical protein